MSDGLALQATGQSISLCWPQGTGAYSCLGGLLTMTLSLFPPTPLSFTPPPPLPLSLSLPLSRTPFCLCVSLRQVSWWPRPLETRRSDCGYPVCTYMYACKQIMTVHCVFNPLSKQCVRICIMCSIFIQY